MTLRPDYLLTRPCTVIHREPGGSEDDYGNPIMVETTTDTFCYAQQRLLAVIGSEPAEGRAISDWLIVLPIGTNITVADAVHTEGQAPLEVTGDPWVVRNPVTRQLSHIELLAREAE